MLPAAAVEPAVAEGLLEQASFRLDSCRTCAGRICPAFSALADVQVCGLPLPAPLPAWLPMGVLRLKALADRRLYEGQDHGWTRFTHQFIPAWVQGTPCDALQEGGTCGNGETAASRWGAACIVAAAFDGVLLPQIKHCIACTTGLNCQHCMPRLGLLQCGGSCGSLAGALLPHPAKVEQFQHDPIFKEYMNSEAS